MSSGVRLGFILLMVGLPTVLALAGEQAFLKEFSAFLLAFFTPWSAINLVDYYFVTRERYDVPALSDDAGSDVDDHQRPVAAGQHGMRDAGQGEIHLSRPDHDVSSSVCKMSCPLTTNRPSL
ncbi:hypothetical protein UB46_06225 [Burkholderiaceae bacterium 16]|nr:hypothetical protein UB46_06225 [Burkholderiaceae bacterium 16]